MAVAFGNSNQTLWSRCFWICYAEAKDKGDDSVVFDDVDAKVLEISKALDVSDDEFEKCTHVGRDSEAASTVTP